MSRLRAFELAAWLMIIFRSVLRLLLAANGSLEWRGWHFGSMWNFWPSYVTAWEVIVLIEAIVLMYLLWPTREEA